MRLAAAGSYDADAITSVAVSAASSPAHASSPVSSKSVGRGGSSDRQLEAAPLVDHHTSPSEAVSATAPSASSFSSFWWLDVRRRGLVVNEGGLKGGRRGASSESAAFLSDTRASGVVLPATVPTPYVRGSLALTLRQVKVQMWRRGRQLRRDPRSLGLQCESSYCSGD